MKKYVLPTLISLALSHSSILAEEVSEATEVQAPSTVTESPAETSTTTKGSDETDFYQEMVKKHEAYRKYMQTQMQKLREAKDPDEYQRLVSEMQQRRTEMMQEMWGSDRRPSWGGPPPWAGSNWGGPRWGGPAWNNSPNWGGRPWGNWNEPEMNYFRGPRGGGYGRGPNRFGPNEDSLSQIEQRLNNIEQMLQELIDSSKKTAD